MDITSNFSGTGVSFILALIATVVCSLFFRLLKFPQLDKPRACNCNCVGGCESMAVTAAARVMNGGGVVERERQQQVIGASMMEQLVPEITTHALSYLDYPSLCRLSMTNSSMRKAANDDNAWKALYHKDFTMEQDSITPANGWKAYYAATRAIVNINQQFFDIIRERSLPDMGRLWLNADYVKCIHASGEFFTGGCKGCGKAEMEKGCNGEGRIQGGIATVPGFGWWPIKAYRPCPGFVATGGRYRRQGQSMDEVAGFGSVPRMPADTTTTATATTNTAGTETQSSEKKGPRKFKR